MEAMYPTKALVLAAGFGTRMLPLTRRGPKPLLPILGVPNLERVLRMLRAWGVQEAVINLHHGADRLFDFARARVPDGLRVALSFEPNILGTGGALTKASWLFAGRDPVWVVNADVVCALDPVPLLRAFRARRMIASAWVHGREGPRTVEVQRGRIVEFRSARAGTPGTFTFCGVQVVDPRLLAYLPREPVFGSIVAAYERAMADGWRVAGVEAPGSFWADVGTPEQYLACHRALLGGREDASFVDPGARVHPRAVVRGSVVMAGAELGPRARVEGAIVAAGARVDGPVTRMALPAADALEPAALGLLGRLGWAAEACTAMPLSPRGSARGFTRVCCGAATAMAVQYDPARQENAWYARHARFLHARGLPVARVLADDPAGCATLFEDLGDTSLEAVVPGLPEVAVERQYRAVLDVVLRLHRSAAAAQRARLPLMPAFRPVLYRWERAYFAEHMLRGRAGVSAREAAAIQRELAGVGRRLAQEPLVLVHRDLQSSNVLLADGRPHLIDFQGMRLGPAVYDLASLLCDPYVGLPGPLRGRLLDYYAERSGRPAAIRARFWDGAVQRLAQALGAFARLGAQRETASFARHITPALAMLREALAHVPGCGRLRAWVAGATRADASHLRLL